MKPWLLLVPAFALFLYLLGDDTEAELKLATNLMTASREWDLLGDDTEAELKQGNYSGIHLDRH